MEESAAAQNIDDDIANPVLLKSLLDMGLEKTMAEKALVGSKNKSVDAAIEWISNLEDDESEDGDDSEDEIYFKMVFVVNSSLGMGCGKTASQVGHASIGLYREMMKDKEKYEETLQDWELTGEKKITLKGKTAEHLSELQKLTVANDLPSYIVEDAGRTQIPEGSRTVLAIFGDEEAVNSITGSLRLL